MNSIYKQFQVENPSYSNEQYNHDHIYDIYISKYTTSIRITLVYTDTLSSIFAQNVLVNNLDMTAIHMNTNISYKSLLWDSQGDKSPIEVIMLRESEYIPIHSQHYRVIITAKVLLTNQPYALVITEHGSHPKELPSQESMPIPRVTMYYSFIKKQEYLSYYLQCFTITIITFIVVLIIFILLSS